MEQLISNVDDIIFGFVQGSFGGLSGPVEILWRLMFVVFIAVYGYKVMISGQFSASELITHCVKIIVILVLATQWDMFFLFVFDITTSLPSDIAGQLIHAASASIGGYSQSDSEASANNALSLFFDRGMAVSEKLLEGASWRDVSRYFYAIAVWIGTVGLTAYATMLIILAKLAVGLILAVGPLFILLLIFAGTRGLFDGWFKTLLNYALIPVFVYALLAILLVLMETPLRRLEQSGPDAALLSFVGPFLLTAIISMMLLTQIMNITSSVTGGASLSTLGWAMAARRKQKESVTAAKEGWKNSEPARGRMVEAMKNGSGALRNALRKNREVR